MSKQISTGNMHKSHTSLLQLTCPALI